MREVHGSRQPERYGQRYGLSKSGRSFLGVGAQRDPHGFIALSTMVLLSPSRLS